MNKRKILIIIGIILLIPILIICTVFAFYAIDDYLDDYYCIKGGGLEYNTMSNTCTYLFIDENGTETWVIPNKPA